MNENGCQKMNDAYWSGTGCVDYGLIYRQLDKRAVPDPVKNAGVWHSPYHYLINNQPFAKNCTWQVYSAWL